MQIVQITVWYVGLHEPLKLLSIYSNHWNTISHINSVAQIPPPWMFLLGSLPRPCHQKLKGASLRSWETWSISLSALEVLQQLSIVSPTWGCEWVAGPVPLCSCVPSTEPFPSAVFHICLLHEEKSRSCSTSPRKHSNLFLCLIFL